METRVAEVADGVHQLATYISEMDFGVNQYVVGGEEPFLFHTGMRGLFPLVSDAFRRVRPVEDLQWVGFGHVEADECGAMNAWLGVAPHATIVQSEVGCMVSIGDLADREPRALADGEVLDTGGHRLRWIDTPHVPHAWEAGVVFDETTRTLFCGDLFSQMGQYEPTTTADIVGPAVAAEDGFRSCSLAPEWRHRAPARRSGRGPPGADARSGVHRRLPAGAARPGGRLRSTPGLSRRGWPS
jgi:flavorubredoxin